MLLHGLLLGGVERWLTAPAPVPETQSSFEIAYLPGARALPEAQQDNTEPPPTSPPLTTEPLTTEPLAKPSKTATSQAHKRPQEKTLNEDDRRPTPLALMPSREAARPSVTNVTKLPPRPFRFDPAALGPSPSTDIEVQAEGPVYVDRSEKDSAANESQRREQESLEAIRAALQPRPGGRYEYRTPDLYLRATIDADGSVKFKITRPDVPKRYVHGRKARFLEATRELRAEMVLKLTRKRMATQQRALRGQLTRIWHADNRTELQKRRRLFKLWEETSVAPPPGLSSIDALRSEQGQQARRQIEAFIRKYAPEGSEHGYSLDELRALNAEFHLGPKNTPFAPYR